MSATLVLWAKSGHRPACSECQQRKERCDREWPCDKCCRRKVPDWCRYEQPKSSSENRTQSESRPEQSSYKSSRSLRKRKLKAEEDELGKPEASVDDGVDEETTLKAIGYMPSSSIQLSKLSKFQPSQPAGFIATQEDIICAMEMLPPMHHLETLLRSFTKMINCCYYIIYPPRLMEVYSIWREEARLDRLLDPTVVCLMLRVCACAVLCLRFEVQETIEADLNIPIQDFAHRCSQAAIELSGKIPIGRGGLLQVQQLLLTSYWHSSEGQFFDCWHALGAAIREAQEIGIHRDSKADGLNELDLELRRRIWCILDCWDWQISTLFSRPRLINRYDCNANPPNVSFEGTPSPILQMKLQLDIIQIAYRKFGNTNKSLGTAKAKEFTNTIKEWMESFPPMFRIEDPDISMDKGNAWITLHRQYLHVMTYTMILVPLKAYICRTFECKVSQEKENLRAAGIDYCLKLRDAHVLLFHSTYPFCARFHLAQFSLVDLGLVLCSAIIHDEHRTLPKREEVIGVIGNVVELLRHIQGATGRSSTSYRLISRLVGRLPISQYETQIMRSRHITVKFDYGLKLARRPAQTCAEPIVMSVRTVAAAKAQPTTSATLMHCIQGPPTPASISNNEPTPFELASLQGFLDTGDEADTADTAIESAYPLDPSEHDRPTALIQTSAKPILDVFLERFLDSYGPEMPSVWQPQYWIHAGQPYQIWRTGAAMRSSSPLLFDSFTAVSVAQFGRSIGDWNIVSAADKIYCSVLQSLQTAIYHPEESKSDDALWSAILCAVYEGVSGTRQNGFLTHLRGILHLLEFRGAERHISGIAHGLFAELRCFFVFAAITTRSRTFLARPDWKHVPWSAVSTPKDLLQHVLDDMVEIPALLGYADQIKRCAGTTTAVEMGRLQQELWTLATNIEHSLYQWKQEWAEQYPGGQARQLPLPAGDPFPVFQCRDNVTGNIVVYDNMLVFPDPVLAQAFCHYYAALILVFSADPRPRDPGFHDIYSLSCLICRIMGYFVRTVPSGLASRVAYPFRLAYDCLPEGGMERMYIEEIFRLIAKRRSSQEWQCTLGGLTVPKC